MNIKTRKIWNRALHMGSVQRAWVDGLRANAELQVSDILGTVDDQGNLTSACCLGYLHYTNNGMDCTVQKGEELIVTDGGDDSEALQRSYKDYGLRSHLGQFGKTNNISGSLASMNDGDFSWDEIADFIELNPQRVFTHKV